MSCGSGPQARRGSGPRRPSISVSTSATGQRQGVQYVDAWGKKLNGTVSQTKRSYTGQYLDDTGFLFYNARYYDPGIGRFVSADSIVPGNASGGMAGIAYKPLTVDVHEPGFVAKIAQENQFGPWYLLSDKEKQQLGAPWGPANPQALNRYSYVLNNPLRWVDPGGHSVYMTQQQARQYIQDVKAVAQLLRDSNAVQQLLTAILSGADAVRTLLEQRGVSTVFSAALANMVAPVLAWVALYGIAISEALENLARDLDWYVQQLAPIVENSLSGIIVSNGCAFHTGQSHATNGCGITVVSRDTGHGVKMDMGPAGFLVGWGGIWSSGKAYTPDGRLYTGPERYREDE